MGKLKVLFVIGFLCAAPGCSPRQFLTRRLAFELIANSASGRGTTFDGVNVTGGTFTLQSGVTFNITLNGSDGSRISHHENAHSNVRPNGEEVFFEMCH